MKVLKFGGSSVGSSDRIEKVISIISDYRKKNNKIAVVFSAFQAVTDKLIKLGELAYNTDESYLGLLHDLRLQHLRIVQELINKNSKKVSENVTDIFEELNELLKGVFLIKELTPKTQDKILSYGERLSCYIISEALNDRKIVCDYCDASDLIITDSRFGSARVDFKSTNKNIDSFFKKNKNLQIITGFISSNNLNERTTLGRGGSDYTAAIIGAALNVTEIEIWTDVNGIMTADPRKVKDSKSLNAVTYEEAMELSYFGAKVIHPPTMYPALEKKIKIRIRNTFDTSFKGTVVLQKEDKIEFSTKGISSIDDVSLIYFSSSSLISINNVDSRIFKALADEQINILLITQSSSGYNTCIAILPHHADRAKEVIEKEFELELINKKIKNVSIENEFSLLAVVGEDLRSTPGVSGKVFQPLGKNGINITAVAQGSSERNITLVIKKNELSKALNVLHESLFQSQKRMLNIFLVGPGLVGSALINYLEEKRNYTSSKLNTEYRIVGIANSKKMVFDYDGINVSDWKRKLSKSKSEMNPKSFVNEMINSNLPNSIFVDCTATEHMVPYYEKILNSSISITTPNKIANTNKIESYNDLRTAAKNNNVQFRYSTNVGAGLPIINNLKDFISNGEEITKIEGVMSGTLSFLFNSFKKKSPFSKIVLDAKNKGYTEPDPREDLNGLDAGRKLLILIRELGIPMELNEVDIENLVPAKARKVKSVEEFFKILTANDDAFEKRKLKASKENKALCYIAKYEKGKASVKLEAINQSHPFYSLNGNDNIFTVTTKNYNEQPLTIRGRGAGAEFTASGIYMDILRIANYLS